MDTRCYTKTLVFIFFFSLLASCVPTIPPTPYLPPTSVAPIPSTLTSSSSSLTPAIFPTEICYNGLTFLDDVTFPDNTIVTPGSVVDKQWLVQNTGTCAWNSSYHLRFIGASLLDAMEEQALYPARAGSEALIRIQFTAPLEPGQYVSLWQAVDPYGMPFGDIFQITIIVEP